jgi:hypothetical protein
MHFHLLLTWAGLSAKVAAGNTESVAHASNSVKRSEQSHRLTLNRASGGEMTSAALRLSSGDESYRTSLLSLFEDIEYVVNVTIGHETRVLILDTGSSDTWVIEPNYACFNQTTYAVVNHSVCDFGPGLSPSDNFQQIPDVNLNATYGQGTTINGILGYETLNLAGLDITEQEIGYGTDLYWPGYGDGTTSGILGMAFGNLTSQYSGTNFSADVLADVENYSPVAQTIIFGENLTEPYFSLELSRAGRNSSSGFGGYLETGAVPDFSIPGWASVPMEAWHLPNTSTNKFYWYVISIDGTVDGGSFYPAYTTYKFIVDSGTTLLYLPGSDAARINAQFDPPAQIIDGLYAVQCNASIPQNVGLQIGGITFLINSQDLINLSPFVPGYCITGIQDGDTFGDDIYILGDVFLVNALTVFGRSMRSISRLFKSLYFIQH